MLRLFVCGADTRLFLYPGGAMAGGGGGEEEEDAAGDDDEDGGKVGSAVAGALTDMQPAE